MKKLLLLALAALFTLVAGIACAQAELPKQSTYRILTKPQTGEVDGKVEVIEFFWYNCPHCYEFEPTLTDWHKTASKDISFKRVPVIYRPDFIPQARAYYAFESLGKLEDLHKKMFTAIHSEKKPLNTVEQIADWVATQGVDKEAFMKAYTSFSVQTKANRAKQLTEAFDIDGTPTLAIGGKYTTTNDMARSVTGGALKVVDQLASAIKAKKL